jgi:hypothetical protein
MLMLVHFELVNHLSGFLMKLLFVVRLVMVNSLPLRENITVVTVGVSFAIIAVLKRGNLEIIL